MQPGGIVELQSRIETPENVLLTLRLAGPASRLSAYLIDLLIRVAIVWILSYILNIFSIVLGGALPMGAMLVSLFLIEWGYYVVCEGLWNGTTPGKRAVGLRVVKAGGYPVGLHDVVVRNLLRAADVLPIGYGVGLATMFFAPRFERLGDLAAGTVVVRERREVLRRRADEIAEYEPLPADALRAGRRPSERTLDLIEGFAERMRALSRARRDEIAGALAPVVGARLLAEGREGLASPPADFLLRLARTYQIADEGRSESAGAGAGASGKETSR